VVRHHLADLSIYNGRANDYYDPAGNGVLYYPGHRFRRRYAADISGPVPSIRLKPCAGRTIYTPGCWTAWAATQTR
jgi:hypothetical protein